MTHLLALMIRMISIFVLLTFLCCVVVFLVTALVSIAFLVILKGLAMICALMLVVGGLAYAVAWAWDHKG